VPRLALSLALCLLAACGGDEPSLSIRLQVLTGNGPCAGSSLPGPLSQLNASTLRLSVIRRAIAGPALVCDTVIGAGSAGRADLTLDTSDASARLDLLVEAFDSAQPPRRLAIGSVVGINRRPRLDALQVVLARAGRSSCTAAPMGAARAFHSATTLPNGQILLFGGVARIASGGADQLWLTPSAEVYDPRTGAFHAIAGDLPAPRAMHTALLLDGPSDGPYDVLLAGGIAAKSGSTDPVLRVGGATDALPLVPATGAVAASSVVLRVYPWADPPQAQQLGASPELRTRMLHAATVASGKTLLLGGASDFNPSDGKWTAARDVELLPVAGTTWHSGPFPLQRPRLGAVAGELSSTAVLLFGGNLLSETAKVATEAAEIIKLDDPPSSALADIETGSTERVASVAHATLTRVAQGELLLAGGFGVEGNRAVTPRQQRPVLRMTLVADKLRVTEVTGAFTPAGYLAAAPFTGGVLLCGGKPASCSSGAICGSDKVYRFTAADGSLVTEGQLIAPRMGHALTTLDESTLLVSGGLDQDGTGVVSLSSAELMGIDGGDLFGRGAAMASGSRCE
jgi:hypothetical protein